MHVKLTPKEPNWVQRQFKRFAYSRAGRRIASHILHFLDRLVMKYSNGRYTASELLGGLPIIFLMTIGAKSGQPRTTPLIATPDNQRIVVVASNWGREGNPAWYYNVLANPEVIVVYRDFRAAYRASEVFGLERVACWEEATRLYPGYVVYQQMVGGREIPVIVLEPARLRPDQDRQHTDMTFDM